MDVLDRRDIAILSELQRDSRLSMQALAERVGMSTTPCWQRVKKLEAAGIITGYSALVDRRRVGLALMVIAEVNLSPHSEDTVRRFERAVLAAPAIVSCWSTTGQADYVLRVLVQDIVAYEHFLHETVFKLPGVTHVRSSVALREVKAEVRLPMAAPPAVKAAKPVR